MTKPSFKITIDGPVENFVITDVPRLQYLAKTNWELYERATERLRKARRQRTDAVILLRQVQKLEHEGGWGGEYGPNAARLLDKITRFLKENPLEKHE